MGKAKKTFLKNRDFWKKIFFLRLESKASALIKEDNIDDDFGLSK